MFRCWLEEAQAEVRAFGIDGMDVFRGLIEFSVTRGDTRGLILGGVPAPL